MSMFGKAKKEFDSEPGHVSDLSFDTAKLSSKVKCKPELEKWDETEKRSTDSVPSSLPRSLSFYLQPALDEGAPLRIYISTYACVCTSVCIQYTCMIALYFIIVYKLA